MFRKYIKLFLMGCLFYLGIIMPSNAIAETNTVGSAITFTQDINNAILNNKIALDTVWVLVTAFLVFFMNLGFAMVESGLCRAKNAVNILSKNVIVFCVTTFVFWIVGFAIMFGNGNSLFGTEGWALFGADNSPATGDAYQ